MKVYCAAPIRGRLDHKAFQDKIPLMIEEAGHTALSEAALPSPDKLTDQEIFIRDINWLKESDCMVAEVSSASSGVGFEISYALYQLNIPVLALYKNNANVSAMIKGCSSSLLKLVPYTSIDEMKNQLNNFMNSVRVDVARKRLL
jgi:2'-deoxynucleoside 5'-phosphate N-hydrolase